MWIVLWVFVAAILVCALIVLKPLMYLIPLKIKYGNKTVLKFYPILGLQKYLLNSLKQEGDVYAQSLKTVRTKPEVKFAIGNLLLEPAIEFLDHTYAKQVFIEHHNYEKFEVILDKYKSNLDIVVCSHKDFYLLLDKNGSTNEAY